MRILITGASGLLGLNLALEFAHAPEHHVFGAVNRHALNASALDPAFSVLTTDLLAPGAVERLLDQAQPDWVIHCAALAVLDACETDPARAQQLNTQVPAKLAQHVARGGARLVHISTDSVFDGQRGQYTEQDAPHPLSVYAQTKLDGERAVLEANPQAIVARVNLIGWSMSAKRSLSEFFFYNLQAGKQVLGFTNVYFCPLLANHLAPILSEMLEKDLHGLYHAVGSQCLNKYDFGVALARRFDLQPDLITPASVEEAGLKAARSPRLTLRTDKLAQALGHPLPNLSTALDGLYQLYQQGYPQHLQSLRA